MELELYRTASGEAKNAPTPGVLPLLRKTEEFEGGMTWINAGRGPIKDKPSVGDLIQGMNGRCGLRQIPFGLVSILLVGLFLGVVSAANAADETGTPWDRTLATPGVHLWFVEVWRRLARPEDWSVQPSVRGTTVVSYEFKGTGMPPGKQYHLWLGVSYQRPVRTRFLVHFNAAGELLTEAGGPLKMTLGAYHKGEPAEIGIESTDGQIRATARAFPFPIEASDRSCHLMMEMLTADGKAFGAIADGFPPGSTVETVSRSDGEVLRRRVVVPGNGKFSVVLLPAAVAGHQHGSFEVKASSCSVKVDYAWGAAALVPQ